MPHHSTASPDSDGGDADTWPWQCLDCGTTIYHDGEFCRDCRRAHRFRDHGRGSPAPDGLVDWIREQRPAPFVLKVSAVAALELALTAFWIQLLLGGTLALGGVGPFPV